MGKRRTNSGHPADEYHVHEPIVLVWGRNKIVCHPVDGKGVLRIDSRKKKTQIMGHPEDEYHLMKKEKLVSPSRRQMRGRCRSQNLLFCDSGFSVSPSCLRSWKSN